MSPVQRALAAYGQGPQSDAELLRKHGHIVDRLARRLVIRTGLHSAYDDLWSAGALGLIEAARRYEDGRNATFETFAEHRVRGAMLDEMRRLDHLPRRLRTRTDELTKARRKLGTVLGRDPTVEELAAELGVGLEEASRMDALLAPHLPLDSALPFLANDAGGGEDPVERGDLLRALTAAAERLPARLQTVLALHYLDGLTYREIGTILDISEPRVCQLHADAISRLRNTIDS